MHLGRRGQSLIEVIVALAILTTAIIAIFGLSSMQTALAHESELRVIASNLAREGIEVARALRDSNILKGMEFDTDLKEGNDYTAIPVFTINNTSSFWAFDFSPTTIADSATQVYQSGIWYLQFSSSATGSLTPFSRILTFNEICASGVLKTSGFSCSQSGEEKKGVQILSEVRVALPLGRIASTLIEDRLYK